MSHSLFTPTCFKDKLTGRDSTTCLPSHVSIAVLGHTIATSGGQSEYEGLRVGTTVVYLEIFYNWLQAPLLNRHAPMSCCHFTVDSARAMPWLVSSLYILSTDSPANAVYVQCHKLCQHHCSHHYTYDNIAG